MGLLVDFEDDNDIVYENLGIRKKEIFENIFKVLFLRNMKDRDFIYEYLRRSKV